MQRLRSPWGFPVRCIPDLPFSTNIFDLDLDCSMLTAASTVSSARALSPFGKH